MKEYVKWLLDNKNITEMLLAQSIMIIIWAQCISWAIRYAITHTKYNPPAITTDSPVIVSSSEYLKLRMKENRYHVVVVACIVITILIAALTLIAYFNGGVN